MEGSQQNNISKLPEGLTPPYLKLNEKGRSLEAPKMPVITIKQILRFLNQRKG